jgi:hypothetical protein
VDGVLDEAVYDSVPPFGDLVQVTPEPGAPSSERSEIWVMYDETHIYVACRCYTSVPPDDWVVNEYRRDSSGLRQNDHFAVGFDTFYDRRSGFMFYANPLGARADYSIVDEGSPNSDWDPVWEVRTGRFDGGWTMEMAIPFRSLRYHSGQDQVWGFQVRRSIRYRNEWTYLNPVPAFLAGPQGLNRVSSNGTLVGLDLPDAGRNIEVKPYALAGMTTDRLHDPAVDGDWTGDVGVDFKYGITANLTADVTINTDFAQVEVDEQRVDPHPLQPLLSGEARVLPGRAGEFRLWPGSRRRGTGRWGRGCALPLLQSSDRSGGRPCGADSGRRKSDGQGRPLRGRSAEHAYGGLSAEGIEPTTFSVARLKRDVFGSSAIGGMFTHRSLDSAGNAPARAYGVDGTFRISQDLRVAGYLARTETEGFEGNDRSYQGSFDYVGDLYGARVQVLEVGDAFNPEVGFTRRRGFRKTAATARFSPRPASLESIRRLTWDAGIDYFEGADGRLESREQSGSFEIDFENSDAFSVSLTSSAERLVRPFRVAEGLTIPVGFYDFTRARARYQFGAHRRASGNVAVEHGGFFDGTMTSVSLSQGRVIGNNHLSIDPSITYNRVDHPEGELRQTLLRSRVDYAFGPLMFASAFLQYNTNDRGFSSNLRFRWEYSPGSELFVVWTDERDWSREGMGLRSQAFMIKATRLLWF